MRIAALLFGLAVVSLFAASPTPRPITPCELHDSKLNGQHVVVLVRVLFTMHGAATLTEPGCPGHGGKAWAAISYPEGGTPVVDFSMAPGSEEKLRPFYVTVLDKPKVACVALEGQLFVLAGFRLIHLNGVPVGNGFGEEGRARSSLVVRKVLSATPCDD